MAGRTDIREFLMSRRARVTPEQAGLTTFSRRRRVDGLRREEVAMLAGVSVEYYTRLERGTVVGVSDEVLHGVASALQLDEAERAHLFDLVRAQTTRRPVRRNAADRQVRPVIQQILDSIAAPAYVRNGRLDILAANELGRALYADVLAGGRQARPVNMARFTFLDPRARMFFDQWDGIASDAVAVLRAEAGRDPYDRRLSDLIGELSTLSDEFRVRWAAHNVKHHQRGAKLLHHPVVGDLYLSYEAFEIAGDEGQRVLVYAAEPGSISQDGLNLLASWAATPRPQLITDDDR